MASINQDAVSAADNSDGPANKRMRHQVTAAQDTYVHPARPHLLAGQAPVHNSQLNVQSLYHMQMPHASIPHHALQGGGQALLQLPQQLETAQQLGLADKHELDRLDSPDGDIPTSTDYRHKQRRKANERPSGTDQMRQAFSKRKRGLALKCYQLHKLTDAKVFCFIMNEKGSSWAYATPGFGASLSKPNLAQMRSLTGFEQPADVSKQVTELIPHPTPGDADDRDPYGGAAASVLQPAETAPSSLLVGGPEYDAEPDVVESGATRDVGVQAVFPSMPTASPPTSDAQNAPDEVRSLVADLAHLAYSRGLPGSFSANAPTAQSDHMGVGIPPPQLLQQAMMTVPVHLIPGHPSFDQHAYQMLVQQQQQELHDQEQEQQQHQQEQQQHQYSYQQQHQQLLHSEQQQPVNAGMTQQRDGMQAAHEEGTSSGMPADQHAVLDSDAHEGAAQQQQQHDKSVRPAASPLD